MELQTMPLRFRVWDKEDKRFLTDQYDNIHFVNLYWLGNFMCHELEEEEYEISQDTGLKDKNGKSIYTGDIVKHDRCCIIPAGVIHYNQRSSKIVYNEFNDGLYNSEKLIEVIGNIWQNPELLEEKSIDKS